VLGSLSVIERWNPDQIVIDTPGQSDCSDSLRPGMLDIKCFVTFSPEVSHADLPDTEDGTFEAVEKYLKYLCSLADGEYRGEVPHEKMLFKRRNELFENPSVVRCS